MPRITSSKLDTRNARAKLKARPKPYWFPITRGVVLGYRAGPGSWCVRVADGKGGNRVTAIGRADDRDEPANGATTFTFEQAMNRAHEIARGKSLDIDTGDGSHKLTVREAFDKYRDELGRRMHAATNAKPRHLPATLLDKEVSALTQSELLTWRNGLLKTSLKASSVNRYCKSLKAALNFVADESEGRISNEAWRVGLKLLPEVIGREIDNTIDEDESAALVAAAYRIGGEDFGVYVELHAVTGMRTSQLRLLRIRDLDDGPDPELLILSSLKGKRIERRTITLPIPVDVAIRLRAYAAGRKPNDLLLRSTFHSGGAWQTWRKVVFAAGLDPKHVNYYSFRHTMITRALANGLPIREVASTFDTSVQMIEKTYARFLRRHVGAERVRAALVSDRPNVVVKLRA